MNQADKAAKFIALHQQERPLLIPNPWDIGSTRLLQSLGFEALATTSLGLANMLGVKRVSKQQLLANCQTICQATSLPVTVDLENCYADLPADAAAMIAPACEHGAVGASIEDWSGNKDQPIYDFELAVERVAAAAEVARSLPIPFVLTARAEDRLHRKVGLDDTIKRLQAYEKAGADVLYAPGLHSFEEMQTVCSALTKPVNVVMGFGDPELTLDRLAEAGVKRVSIGGALSRLALKAFMDGAREMREGKFTFVADVIPIDDLWDVFPEGEPSS